MRHPPRGTRIGVVVAALLAVVPTAGAGGGKPAKGKPAPVPPLVSSLAEKLPDGCAIVADGFATVPSPDGKRLAYVRGGDLPILLLRHTDRSPAVELVFRDLKTGATTKLPNASLPVGWIDGALLLASGAAVDPAKGVRTPRSVSVPGDGMPATVAWTNDGKRVAWVPSVAGKGANSVHVSGPNGADVPVAATAGLRTDQAVFLAWSPDASRLYVNALFQHEREVPVRRVDLVDVSTGAATTLATMPDWIGIPGLHDGWERYRDPRVEDPTVVDLAYRRAPEPRYGRQVFSGDGRLAVWLAGTGWIEADAFVVEVATGTVKRVTNDGDAKWSPALDPTGRRLAFLTADNVDLLDGFKQPRIRVIDLLTGEPTEVPLATTKGIVSALAFTPDGAAVTYEIRDLRASETFRQALPAPKAAPAGATVRALDYDPRNRIVAWLASYDVDRVHTALHRAEDAWDPYYLPALREALGAWKDREGPVVHCMAHMFRLKGLRETIPDLRAALATKDDGHRLALLETLHAFGEGDALAEIGRLARESKDASVRVLAGLSLVRRGDDAGWAVLEAVAKEGDVHARATLCAGLATIRQPKSVELLIPLVADHRGDPTYPSVKIDIVSPAAQRALRALTGQSLGDDPSTWRRWWTGVAKGEVPPAPTK